MLQQRTRIPEPDSNIIQLHRNTRVDPHTIQFSDNLNSVLLHRYPCIDEFKEQYAEFLNVKHNNITLTSGVEGAIKLVFSSLPKGCTVGILQPTYAMYGVYAELYGVSVSPIYPKPYPFEVSINDIKSKCEYCKAIFIPNPNAPIENVFSVNDIEDIVSYAAKFNCMIFIDEAYHGFGAPTCIELVSKYDNVVVGRSFSKWFGLPSIRLGCLVGSEKTITPLETKRLAYETNSLSVAVATKALENIQYFDNYANVIVESKKQLKTFLHSKSILFHGSLSNNILIKLQPLTELDGILIRKNIPDPALGWSSVTIGGVDVTEKLISSLHKWL